MFSDNGVDDGHTYDVDEECDRLCTTSGIDSGFEDDEFDYEDIDDRFIMSSPEEDKLMNTFYQWLISVDGGLKPPRSAMQHKNVVLSIVHHIDSAYDYTKLFSRPHLNGWVTYCETVKRKAGTIKTYLGSVKLFYQFVLINTPEMVNVNAGDSAKMMAIVGQWCRNYHKKIKIAKHAKQLEDLTKLPTSEEIRNLDNSPHQKQAINLLSQFSCNGKPINRKDYCHARDYLLTYIIMDNASRSGCISNMTLKEYQNAEVQDDGSYIISVMDHKTVATSGPAMLSITDVIMRHLNTFVNKIRNQIKDMLCSDSAPVFVSWSGKKMATSMVSTQLNTFWKNGVDVDFERRICATLIRKMSTTVVHANEPSLKVPLAQLINHDVRTAEREYFLQEKKKCVAGTSARLRQAIRTDYSSTDVSDSKLVDIFTEDVLTLYVVREKIGEFQELSSIDPKKLYDKVKCPLKF